MRAITTYSSTSIMNSSVAIISCNLFQTLIDSWMHVENLSFLYIFYLYLISFSGIHCQEDFQSVRATIERTSRNVPLINQTYYIFWP